MVSAHAHAAALTIAGSQRVRHGRKETGGMGAQEPPGRRDLGDGRNIRGEKC